MESEDRIESRIIRSVLGVVPEPRVDLFWVAAKLGVREFRATCFGNGFTDFSSRRPVIFLNRNESGPRMRFILAHEIAHVMLRMPQARHVLEMSGKIGLLNDEEELADHIGAAILLPDGWVHALRQVRYSLGGLEYVAHLADVPLMVLIGRMSRAQINIGLLHWWRGTPSWYVIDRPGVPSCLRGDLELSDIDGRKFDNLGNKESVVSIDGFVNGKHMEIAGLAYRREREVFQLIEPSCKVWLATERSQLKSSHLPPDAYSRYEEDLRNYWYQEDNYRPAHCAD